MSRDHIDRIWFLPKSCTVRIFHQSVLGDLDYHLGMGQKATPNRTLANGPIPGGFILTHTQLFDFNFLGNQEVFH